MCIPMTAFADLAYNPDHDEALKNLRSVETATVNLQYQCGGFSLFISAFATESDVNGRLASVTGKIVSEKSYHEISEQLSQAISRDDILSGKMQVACNAEKGAFRFIFMPSIEAGHTYGSVVSVFADGSVSGSRAIRRRMPQ